MQSKTTLALLRRVAFLVHESIPLTDWKVTPCKGHNIDLIATLSLATDCGDVEIHNVYNHLTALNIDELMETCTGKGASILVGNFNLHHPSWSGAKKKSAMSPKQMSCTVLCKTLRWI